MHTGEYNRSDKAAGAWSWPLTYIMFWYQEWWSYTSTPPYVFMAKSFIKNEYEYNFTFTFVWVWNVSFSGYRLYCLVEVGSNTSTVALRVVGSDKKGNLESETVKYGRESHGTRNREWMRWRGPAVIVNDSPILSSERLLYKDHDRRCSIEKKISDRESQGARRQDEMIGGIPPVVK
jgi:hypothetical protein